MYNVQRSILENVSYRIIRKSEPIPETKEFIQNYELRMMMMKNERDKAKNYRRFSLFVYANIIEAANVITRAAVEKATAFPALTDRSVS